MPIEPHGWHSSILTATNGSSGYHYTKRSSRKNHEFGRTELPVTITIRNITTKPRHSAIRSHFSFPNVFLIARLILPPCSLTANWTIAIYTWEYQTTLFRNVGLLDSDMLLTAHDDCDDILPPYLCGVIGDVIGAPSFLSLFNTILLV